MIASDYRRFRQRCGDRPQKPHSPVFRHVRSGLRSYRPDLGRWLSHDPIDEGGGWNLYAFIGNDAMGFIDSLGLWKSGTFGTQHKDLTVGALVTAWASLRDKGGEKCRSRIADTLVSANEGQDDGAGYSDFSRHFNREYVATENSQEVQQRRTAARDAYVQYLTVEEVNFDYIPDCWERLKALGRLSHSWQDFYAHAIHATRGFVDPIAGAPSGFTGLWPSSYNSWHGIKGGEHPNRGEPVPVASQRYAQAEAYTALRFRKMLTDWLASCKCLCRQ